MSLELGQHYQERDIGNEFYIGLGPDGGVLGSDEVGRICQLEIDELLVRKAPDSSIKELCQSWGITVEEFEKEITPILESFMGEVDRIHRGRRRVEDETDFEILRRVRVYPGDKDNEE